MWMWQFFWLQPLACEPAEMSKYQSSRVMDARVRAEEAQRYMMWNSLVHVYPLTSVIAFVS